MRLEKVQKIQQTKNRTRLRTKKRRDEWVEKMLSLKGTVNKDVRNIHHTRRQTGFMKKLQ